MVKSKSKSKSKLKLKSKSKSKLKSKPDLHMLNPLSSPSVDAVDMTVACLDD